MKKTNAFLLATTCGAVLAAGTLWAEAPSSPPATSTPPAAKPAQSAAAKPAHAATALKTLREKQSYAIGMNIGATFKGQSIDVDTVALMKGIKDTLAGGKMLLTEEEKRSTLGDLQASIQKTQMKKMQELGAKNKAAGNAYLAANKAKPGVVALPSGLQYKILTAGNGAKPQASDTVSVNYKGTLIDGTEFDSSYKRGQPATFPVGGVIKGWTEALQLMPVGSKWQVVIPGDLAYGDSGRPAIPPNSTLVFEVELLAIKSDAKNAAPPAAPKAATDKK